MWGLLPEEGLRIFWYLQQSLTKLLNNFVSYFSLSRSEKKFLVEHVAARIAGHLLLIILFGGLSY